MSSTFKEPTGKNSAIVYENPEVITIQGDKVGNEIKFRNDILYVGMYSGSKCQYTMTLNFASNAGGGGMNRTRYGSMDE